MKVTLRVMLPIFLYWPSMSEIDVDDMAADVEPFHQYSITLCCCVTDGRRVVWKDDVDIKVSMKQRCGNDSTCLNLKITINNWLALLVLWDKSIDFIICDSDLKEKMC